MKIFFLLLAMPCLAREYPIKRAVESDLLHRELLAAGFKVDAINCVNRVCKLSMPNSERKDPSAVIAAHDEHRVAKRLERVRTLADKLDNGTIIPAEKDELLRMLVLKYLGR